MQAVQPGLQACATLLSLAEPPVAGAQSCYDLQAHTAQQLAAGTLAPQRQEQQAGMAEPMAAL